MIYSMQEIRIVRGLVTDVMKRPSHYSSLMELIHKLESFPEYRYYLNNLLFSGSEKHFLKVVGILKLHRPAYSVIWYRDPYSIGMVRAGQLNLIRHSILIKCHEPV